MGLVERPTAPPGRPAGADDAFFAGVNAELSDKGFLVTSAEDVAGQLRSYLDAVQRQPEVPAILAALSRHLDTVSRS